MPAGVAIWGRTQEEAAQPSMEGGEATSKAGWLALALAAVLGASASAATSYLLHKRALDHVLAKSSGESARRDGGGEYGDARRRKGRSSSRQRHAAGLAGRDSAALGSSSSLSDGGQYGNGDGKPVVARLAYSVVEGGDRDGDLHASMSSIPPGLPRVQTRREGKQRSLLCSDVFCFYFLPPCVSKFTASRLHHVTGVEFQREERNVEVVAACHCDTTSWSGIGSVSEP